jgi:hypothetical protein
MTRQHYRQHDSASTSQCGQDASVASSRAWLGTIVASMTRHLHHVVVKLPRQCHHEHDSIALSLAWLSIYITQRLMSPLQHCHQQDLVALSLAGLGNIITNMTRQHHRQQDSTAPSPAWFGSIVASMTQHRCHATSWSSTSTIHDFCGKQAPCQLIPVLFIIMFGSRANASIMMHCLAPPWSF